MDRAALDTVHPLELRVLDGPQGGARAPLEAGAPWVLAAGGTTGDIVLMEPEDEARPPARIRVTAGTAQALLEVLEGEVRLGDQVLAAGAHAVWPRHVSLTIGSSVVAFGLARVEQWLPEPEDGPAHGAIQGAALESALAVQGPVARPPLHQRAEVWLAGMGAALVLACAGTLGLAHMAARGGAAAAPPPLAVALQASEFATLRTALLPDGRSTLSGRLATNAERQRLDAWLAAGGFTPVLNVKVDEAVAHDVAEVFRVNGVPVQVQQAGAGRFVAVAAQPDPARLARAEGVVRRDVQGFDQLQVRNTAEPALPPAPPVPDDPGKRIASLVQGDPSYVVTADGSRYFVGATLPTGHRITQVEPNGVTLELHGRLTTLSF